MNLEETWLYSLSNFIAQEEQKAWYEIPQSKLECSGIPRNPEHTPIPRQDSPLKDDNELAVLAR